MYSRRAALFLLLFLSFTTHSFAQVNKYTVSGTVKDKRSGEIIIGAIIRVAELPNIGTTSNEYGFYSLTLPEKNYTIEIAYVGYKKISTPLTLNKNTTINAILEDETSELNNVEVVGKKADANVRSTDVGMQKLDIKEISKIPVIFGEKDILKTLQLTPGVKSAGDGNSGIFVRGGAADQNLILLDEANVYNASHLLGFFSTFNSDAIKDVTIYKGGMPAQYGGRLSSVLDIKMNDGNDQKYHVGGGIGLIASRLNVEGPIVKDKGSFLVTGRRTYADVFLNLSDQFKGNKLYFYDLNLKANYKLSDKSRLFVSGYLGQDILKFGKTFGIDWGNITTTIRWNYIINPKFFSNTSFIYSNYNYNISLASGSFELGIKSKIDDINLKQDFTYLFTPKNKIRFGFNAIHHTITPGQITSSDPTVNFAKLQIRKAWENALYVSDEWSVSSKLNITGGLRLSSFMLMGGGNFYTYNADGKAISTTTYNAGEVVKTYTNLEPRFSASYMLGETNSIKAGYTRNLQNLHLISNSTSTSPTDLWIASSNNVKPEISDIVSVGYFQNFKNNQYEFSAETYYKTMQNQIDYRNGANTNANDLIEGELLFGIGRAYGLELFLKKKTGKLTGWVSYTLSRTEKQIAGINNGDWYAARQDKTHDIAIVGIYDLTKKLSFAATWVYSTGNAVTFPSGKYYLNNQVQFLYTERNGYRMPAYHRLDLGLTWYRKKTAKRESSWNVSVYNAYGRQNAYTITFEESKTEPNRTDAVQTALFRWVPSITYNFKF